MPRQMVIEFDQVNGPIDMQINQYMKNLPDGTKLISTHSVFSPTVVTGGYIAGTLPKTLVVFEVPDQPIKIGTQIISE